jgi:hypothetical protein
MWNGTTGVVTRGWQRPKGDKIGGKMNILNKNLFHSLKKFQIIEPNEREIL